MPGTYTAEICNDRSPLISFEERKSLAEAGLSAIAAPVHAGPFRRYSHRQPET